MKKRNTKKFRKKIKLKNKQINQLGNYNSINYLSEIIKKIFNEKKYKKLIGYMNQDDSIVSSDLVIKRFTERNELGNELIDNILKNKKEIKIILHRFKEYYQEYLLLLEKYIYLPFNLIGNKYHPRFNEFFDFISQFSFGDLGIQSDEEVSMFRVMDEKEYVQLINGEGVQSPSFTSNPFYLQFLRGNNTLMDTSVKSIFVLCRFKIEDCILSVKSTGESEIVIKKGSKPTFIDKFCEYGIDDLMSDLGSEVVDYLPLTNSELNNGFTYMDGLVNKGYDLSKEYTKTGNQWFRHGDKVQNDWIIKYYKSIDSVLLNYECDNPNITELKKQISEMKSCGSKITNNPFVV